MNTFYSVNYDLYKYEMRIKVFNVAKLWILFWSFKCCYQIFYCQLHAYGILWKGFSEALIFILKKQKHEWYLIWNSVIGLSCGVFFLLKLLGCKSKYHILYNLYQFWILAIKHFHINNFLIVVLIKCQWRAFKR